MLFRTYFQFMFFKSNGFYYILLMVSECHGFNLHTFATQPLTNINTFLRCVTIFTIYGRGNNIYNYKSGGFNEVQKDKNIWYYYFGSTKYSSGIQGPCHLFYCICLCSRIYNNWLAFKHEALCYVYSSIVRRQNNFFFRYLW